MTPKIFEILFSLCMLLVCLPSFAGQRPAPKQPPNEHREKVLSGGTKVNFELPEGWRHGQKTPTARDQVDRVADALSEVNETYRGTLNLPKKFNFRLLPIAGTDAGIFTSLSNTEYRWDLNTVTAGVLLGTEGGQRQTPEKSLVATIHEYGHVLFQTNIERVIPRIAEAKKVVKSYMQIQNRLDKFNLSRRLCEHLEELNGHPRKIQKAYASKCEAERKLRSTRDELDRKLANFPWLKIYGAYNELFADVVAILATNDTGAVMEALEIPNSDQPPEELAKVWLRRFIQCPRPDVNLPSESHVYFASARCEIGNIVTRNLTSTDKAKILRQVFDVLAYDLSETIRIGRVPNQIEDNIRLGASLRRVLTQKAQPVSAIEFPAAQ